MSSKLERARDEVTRLLDVELEFTQRLQAKVRERDEIAGRDIGDEILAAALTPPSDPATPAQSFPGTHTEETS